MQTIAGFEFPGQRHYDAANHFWALHDEGSSRASIGIDRLGLEALGELAYIALPAVGSRIERGDAMGTLEAAKMTTELVAPLSGVVVERNEGLLSVGRSRAAGLGAGPRGMGGGGSGALPRRRLD